MKKSTLPHYYVTVNGEKNLFVLYDEAFEFSFKNKGAKIEKSYTY